MRVILAFFFITSSLASEHYNNPLSKKPELRICRSFSPFLNACVKKSIESVWHHLAKGCSDDNLLSFEPYKMDIFEVSNDLFNEKERFTEISITGLTKYKISEIEVSPTLEQIKFVAFFPIITMSAVYDINTRDEGRNKEPMSGIFSNVKAIIHMNNKYHEFLSTFAEVAEKYLIVRNVSVKLSVDKSVTYVGDQRKNYGIAEIINNIVFGRWKARMDQIKSKIEENASEVIKNAVNSIFHKCLAYFQNNGVALFIVS
ncbi:PREDICTED: uncharacterized protein LOC106742730 [Dinoponera quadriceps]|uniref:Uncharacterized protein LOC106742730 n=1 Tax=Dinoponera quadriceps TaxID=609295 RepID=A0A6P3WZA8_DINQU|nr:PREDICTED: uncharacterized protein LOC106742730 [Dinoponera quadriceps]